MIFTSLVTIHLVRAALDAECALQVPEGMQDEEVDSDVYGGPRQLLNPKPPLTFMLDPDARASSSRH